MHRYVSEHVQTVLEGLGKAMVHEYAWVWAGRQCGWVCVGGVSVSTVSVAGNSKADKHCAEWSVVRSTSFLLE